MKTLILSLFCGCMLFANQLFAQKEKSELLPVVTITAGNDISDNVRNAFLSKFRGAENTRWFLVNQNYLVKFILEDQEHHATFRTNGDLLYHISYGVEKNLPEDVKMKFKSKYDKYSIGRVFNVEREGRNIWIANLENKKNIIIAGMDMDNEVMYEISRYKNATATTTPTANTGN